MITSMCNSKYHFLSYLTLYVRAISNDTEFNSIVTENILFCHFSLILILSFLLIYFKMKCVSPLIQSSNV